MNVAGIVLLLWHNVSLRGLASLPEGRDDEEEPNSIEGHSTVDSRVRGK